MIKKLIVSFFCTLTFFAYAKEDITLSIYEKAFYSQNGEDGVIAKLVELISPPKYCIEFGSYDGITGSNTYLLRKQGWNCLLFDRMFELPEYNLHKEFITAENINKLFHKYDIPEEIGLVSIDIDYNDYYVWKSMDEKAQIVIVEYNATHLPLEDKVVKYHPFYCGDGSNYFGASILALYNLGRSKGYSLVYAESSGTNLFFIRNDIIEEKGLQFKDMNDVEKLYHSPKYGEGPNGGHREDTKKRLFISSDKAGLR